MKRSFLMLAVMMPLAVAYSFFLAKQQLVSYRLQQARAYQNLQQLRSSWHWLTPPASRPALPRLSSTRPQMRGGSWLASHWPGRWLPKDRDAMAANRGGHNRRSTRFMARRAA